MNTTALCVNSHADVQVFGAGIAVDIVPYINKQQLYLLDAHLQSPGQHRNRRAMKPA